jgi:periplasmic protein TonB
MQTIRALQAEPALPKRLGAGLVCSVLAHVAVVVAVTTTPGAQVGANNGARVIAARIAPAPTQPMPVDASALVREVPPTPKTAEPKPLEPKPLAPKPIDPKPAPAAQPGPRLTPPPDAIATTPPSEEAAPAVVPEGTIRKGAYYFAASEIDKPATALETIEPKFPSGADRVEGWLFIRVLINEVGGVDEVEILVSDPEGVFDDTVRAAFSDAKFAPASREGIAVKSRKDIEVKFDPGLSQLAIPGLLPPGVLPPGTLPPGLILPGAMVVPLKP